MHSCDIKALTGDRFKPKFSYPTRNQNITHLLIDAMIKPYVWCFVFPARAGQQLSVFRHPATLLFSCPRPVRRNAEEVCAFVFIVVMYFPTPSPFYLVMLQLHR